jgi:hypothetical protein
METSGNVQRPRHHAPHGMEPYDVGGENDLGALNDEQQKKLNDHKVIVMGMLLNVKRSMHSINDRLR